MKTYTINVKSFHLEISNHENQKLINHLQNDQISLKKKENICFIVGNGKLQI